MCQTEGDFLQLYWRIEAEGKASASCISVGSEAVYGREDERLTREPKEEAAGADELLGCERKDGGRAGDELEGVKKDEGNSRRLRAGGDEGKSPGMKGGARGERPEKWTLRSNRLDGDEGGDKGGEDRACTEAGEVSRKGLGIVGEWLPYGEEGSGEGGGDEGGRVSSEFNGEVVPLIGRDLPSCVHRIDRLKRSA